MGTKANSRLIYIYICLLAVGFLINFRTDNNANQVKKKPLAQAFSDIGEWKGYRNVNMQRDVLAALQLDDYLFRSYQKSHSVASLYIGYYRTTSKLGAAHSPLVCFPGQGWEISAPRKISVAFESKKIEAETLRVSKGLQKEMIVYWFQSYDMTSSGTFFQKVHNFWARLKSKPQDNAFVRVSVSIQNDDTKTALRTAESFIRDFYPVFLSYITT